jgi:hypothetical protein
LDQEADIKIIRTSAKAVEQRLHEEERALRHSVMGKKNFVSSKAINGAKQAPGISMTVDESDYPSINRLSLVPFSVQPCNV